MTEQRHMTRDEYIAAVRECPRATWIERPYSLVTRASRSRLVRGYMVGHRDGGKYALVDVLALRDVVWTARAARESTPGNLRGLIVRSADAITLQ